MDGLSQNWEPVGGFAVTLGFVTGEDGTRRLTTRAAANGQEHEWPGIARQELLQWIEQRMQEARLATHESEPPVAAPEPSHEQLDLELVDLHVNAVDVPRAAVQVLRATGRLRIYEHYDETDLARGFRVEFIFQDLDNGERRTAATVHGQVEPHEFWRPIQCDFPVPSAGRYQVLAAVKTVAGVTMAESPGPVLRVEP